MLNSTRRIETPAAQMRAFKHLVNLTTRLPELRRVFLRCKYLKGGTSKMWIVEVWKGTEHPVDHLEWNFCLDYAASCISDEANLAGVLEDTKGIDLVRIPVESGSYSVIERLLVASESW